MNGQCRFAGALNAQNGHIPISKYCGLVCKDHRRPIVAHEFRTITQRASALKNPWGWLVSMPRWASKAPKEEAYTDGMAQAPRAQSEASHVDRVQSVETEKLSVLTRSVLETWSNTRPRRAPNHHDLGDWEFSAFPNAERRSLDLGGRRN